MTSVLYVVTLFVIINAAGMKKVFTVFDANHGILDTLKELIWDIEKYEHVLTY